MRFEQELLEGTLVRRTHRFHADVKLRSGAYVTAHCANASSMAGCCEPGSRVLLSMKDDPRRRHKHCIEIVYVGRIAVGIHTGRPLAVLIEAIMQQKLAEVAGYATLKRITSTPRASCVDLQLTGNGLRPCQIVTKNVTLAYEKTGYYPDVVRQTAFAELTEMTNVVREGNRAVFFLLAERADVDCVRPADHVDLEYGQAFRDAHQRGVEVVGYRAKVTRLGIELDKKLPVHLASA